MCVCVASVRPRRDADGWNGVVLSIMDRFRWWWWTDKLTAYEMASIRTGRAFA